MCGLGAAIKAAEEAIGSANKSICQLKHQVRVGQKLGLGLDEGNSILIFLSPALPFYTTPYANPNKYKLQPPDSARVVSSFLGCGRKS